MPAGAARPTIAHNDTLGLQGGWPGEYYHFHKRVHDDLGDWWDGGQASNSGHGMPDGYAQRVHISAGQYNDYLVSGRVPYTTTGGLLSDSGALTFSESTGQLTATQYSTLNDANTYLGFPASDAMAFVAGGTETARVTPGMVGVNLGGGKPDLRAERPRTDAGRAQRKSGLSFRDVRQQPSGLLSHLGGPPNGQRECGRARGGYGLGVAGFQFESVGTVRAVCRDLGAVPGKGEHGVGVRPTGCAGTAGHAS